MPIVETLKLYLLMAWNYPGVTFIILGILVNLFAALAVAMRTGTLSLRVIGEFLWRQLGPYILIYVVFALAGDAVGLPIGPIVFGLIQVMLISSIVEKLKLLGVPIPARLDVLITKPPAVEPTPPLPVGH